MTKLSVETEDLAVIIQEVRGTLADVQQLYSRGSNHLWATNRSSTGISSAYQRTTTELTRIVNTLQTTRQVLEELQRDTDKPSSSGIMGKLKSLGESIKHFSEPVVNAAKKVRDVAEGLWNVWTGESAESLLKKMMNNQAAFAAATTTSQFLAANVESIQLKGAFKQQYGQLQQILLNMGQAFRKGGEAAVNSVLSTLRQTDAALHNAYSQLAGYAELFAEDVKEKLDELEEGVVKGLEEVSSAAQTGADYVKSFLNNLEKGAKSVYEDVKDSATKAYEESKRFVMAAGEQIKPYAGLLSIAAYSLPVWGNIKSFKETMSGKDYITGEELKPWERGLSAVGILIPQINGIKIIKYPELAKAGVSMGVDFVPIAGNVKSLAEVIGGKDYITGEKLKPWERGLSAVGIILPQIKAFKAAKIVKVVNGAADVAKNLDHAADAVDGVKKIEKGLDAVEALEKIDDTVDAAKDLNKGLDAADAAKDLEKGLDAADDASSVNKATGGEGSELPFSDIKGKGGASDLYRRTTNIGAFKDLAVPMQLKEVEKIASQAGIGLQGIKIRIVRDPELVGKGLYGWADPKGKVIELYPDAFTDTENLVKTLGHERTHIYQTKTFGVPDSDNLMDYEKGAYGSEESWWQYYQNQKDGK
jgi:hypothetical protein